ncbi:hypothetical protein ACJX0J_011319, partial [Zea mays]
GARTALNLGGTIFGFYPVRVLPSKTAMLPVNPKFLPRVTQLDVNKFFEELCGESKCQTVNEKEMGLLEIKHGLLQVAETLDFLHTRSRRVAMVILGGNLTQGPYDLIFNGKSISCDYSLKGQMNEGKSMEQSNWTVKGDSSSISSLLSHSVAH